MFISRVRSKGKSGKIYISVLLRESSRVGKKVVSKTIAVLTEMPEWLIHVLEQALARGKDALSLDALTSAPDSLLGLRCAESFGALFLVRQFAERCAITKSLGSSDDARLALWQVLARVLSPAVSLLGMVRLAATCGASGALGFSDSFNEDDLYANGAWVAAQQSGVEAKLWAARTQNSPAVGGFFCMM